jgi:hypothetical protein
MDRTTVAQGQSITFSVRTTPETQFVFAMLDGVRAQGTRINTDAAGNHNWQVTVNPTRSATVVIFANSTNVEQGAASMSIPVTVTGTTTATDPGFNVIPGGPGADVTNIGPLGIANLRETPAIAQGQVRLTLNTGPDVGYVWARFDGNQYARGTRIAQGHGYLTWTIDFRPRSWSPQQIQVGANRVFNYTGATLQNFQVTLTQPFVASTAPEIRTATVSPRDVAPGSRATVRITTNEHVGAVWIRDMDGREVNARSIAPNTATTRTWEVDFNPSRSGSITIFANTNRHATGAVSRQENVSVRGQNVRIIDARANTVSAASSNARVRVTTNRYAESVWVINNNRTIHLNHISGTTGNRVWEAEIEGAMLDIEVRASSLRNHVGVDDLLFIRSWNVTHRGEDNQHQWHDPWDPWNPWWNYRTSSGWGRIEEIRIRDDQEPRRGGTNTNRQIYVYVITEGTVNEVRFVGDHVAHSQRMSDRNLGGGRREWRIRLRIATNTPTGWNSFEIEARQGGNVVGDGFVDVFVRS